MNKFQFLCLLLAFTLLPGAASPDQIILTLRSASLQVEQAETLMQGGQVQQAHTLAKKLHPILSETTELHSQLFMALKDVPSAQATAEKEKEMTIEFAKLRDRISYVSGLVSKSQGNYLEAAKHFTVVVQSQKSTKLGEMAYQQLRYLGFSPALSLDDQV